MAGFFCDSSAIVKRYVNEIGSNFVDGLADLKSGNLILLARITRVEVVSAIARRLKNGSVTAADAQNAVAAFQHDLTNNYFTVEITPVLLSVAMGLATKHALRGLRCGSTCGGFRSKRRKNSKRSSATDFGFGRHRFEHGGTSRRIKC